MVNSTFKTFAENFFLLFFHFMHIYFKGGLQKLIKWDAIRILKWNKIY
jgi:hypothetical protein